LRPDDSAAALAAEVDDGDDALAVLLAGGRPEGSATWRGWSRHSPPAPPGTDNAIT